MYMQEPTFGRTTDQNDCFQHFQRSSVIRSKQQLLFTIFVIFQEKMWTFELLKSQKHKCNKHCCHRRPRSLYYLGQAGVRVKYTSLSVFVPACSAGVDVYLRMSVQTSDFEVFKSDLDKRLGSIEETNSRIVASLEKLNRSSERERESDFSGLGPFNTAPTSDAHQAHDTPPSHGAGGPGSRQLPVASLTELNQEVKIISDSLVKVDLPPDCVTIKSTQGVPRELRLAHAIATGSLKYAETALKLTTSIVQSENPCKDEDLAKLAVLSLAQIKFIQGQLAKITVKGLFDDDTAKLYDQVANNPAVFTADVCENIKTASLISGAKQQFSRPRGGYRGNRGRGNRFSDRDRDFFDRASTHRPFGNRRFQSQSGQNNTTAED